jgi:hypothetical protein
MTACDFHGKPVVPDSVKHLDADFIVEVLSRHGVNVTEAAGELGVASADLRRLLWANPKLTDDAVELEERRLDLAEENICEALRIDDNRRRDAASFFVIRHSHRARKRGWTTTSTSVAELSVTANAPARTLTFRRRTSEDDERDAERAEAERVRDEGKLIEHEPTQSLRTRKGLRSSQRSNKANDSSDCCRSTIGWLHVAVDGVRTCHTPLSGIRSERDVPLRFSSTGI